jgi:hypothetical protein
LTRRIAGVLTHPRATLAELVKQPAWVDTWFAILIVWALCGVALLSTDVGQQALIDERVRVIETVGGTVSDDAYAAWQANPPWWVYLTSGSRLLLTPAVTLVAALLIAGVARLDGTRTSLRQALAITVHASVVLVIGQLFATPIHYVRESLTSPLNLARILPLMEEGTWPARLFGTIDLFALWWGALLALGLAILTGRRVGRYAGPIFALFFGFAAVVAAVIAFFGGA